MQSNSTSVIRKNRYKKVIIVLSLLICFGSLFSCGSKKVIHNTINTYDPAIVALKEKYAEILNVDNDKIRNVALYQNIDRWKEVRDSNKLNLGSLNINFVQYLYYLNFKTKLPVKIDKLYKARKTYLFKDCNFLKEGDLVFFRERNCKIKEVGFYLDNHIFVAANAGGDLYYHHLRDSIAKFHVISNAKIIRDGE
ncbi:NlpC/P60 family protein [Ancylomarina sp. 16SWW S1-10-2]|uniref:NlpC/P60 family protein n=1 Tax=Ancylomarina sp. 16SWW S1-10-2 TaxID=2499681 RepID=UPI0012AD6819|nr:NlpC/P60 family protein [Ancylomarina sp. 16SWW S1-10-2]MRT94770.1 hypothetical protein [Ancylomarina sp. 16SWW S1-10-2]